MLFTPEMSGLVDRDRKRAITQVVPEAEDRVLAAVRDAAARTGIWVAIGSLAIAREDGRWANRSFVIDASGEIAMTLRSGDGMTAIIIADDGVGLPSERARLVEPYVTTRARGTGLGLAIVKKIAEEHFGEITFSDRPGGGTIVTMRFDTNMLAAIDSGAAPETGGQDAPMSALSRNRNT